MYDTADLRQEVLLEEELHLLGKARRAHLPSELELR